MAQLQQPFNAQQFDPTQNSGFKQLPIGKHPVVIVASEVKPNSSNQGGMVVFELQVIDGPAKGATGTWNLNLYHQDDKPRQISESQMAALCYATGVFMLTDTAQLHNIPFAVDVENQPLTAQQVEKQSKGETVIPFTQVKKILNPDGSIPGMQGAAPTPPPPPTAPAQAPAQAWGNGAAPAQAPAAASWGNTTPPAQAPVQAPAPAANQWSQGGATSGNKPSWGKQ